MTVGAITAGRTGTLLASGVPILLMWQRQPMPAVVWNVENEIGRSASWVAKPLSNYIDDEGIIFPMET